MNLSVIFFNRYGRSGASSRLRSIQYYDMLRKFGIGVDSSSLVEDSILSAYYLTGRYRFYDILRSYLARALCLCRPRKADLLCIEKELFPMAPLWLELFFIRNRRFTLDYDDAVFHNYDRHRNLLIRFFLGGKLDGLMMRATLVVTGNHYLAERARNAGAKWVEILPTVINLERYPYPRVMNVDKRALPTLVWIGSPSTSRYLEILYAPLRVLALRAPFVLRVIGSDLIIPGVQVECIPWSEHTEVSSISDCDVGVMPLYDSPWELGKCGYKLVQYMACGLPVVASPIGINTTIVQEGINGFLADSDEAWVTHLERLLSNASLRAKLGAAGRRQVEQEYCVQVTGPKLADLLHRAAQDGAE